MSPNHACSLKGSSHDRTTARILARARQSNRSARAATSVAYGLRFRRHYVTQQLMKADQNRSVLAMLNDLRFVPRFSSPFKLWIPGERYCSDSFMTSQYCGNCLMHREWAQKLKMRRAGAEEK